MLLGLLTAWQVHMAAGFQEAGSRGFQDGSTLYPRVTLSPAIGLTFLRAHPDLKR